MLKVLLHVSLSTVFSVRTKVTLNRTGHPHLTLLPFGVQLTQFNLNICFRGTEIEAASFSFFKQIFLSTDFKKSLVSSLNVEIYSIDI